MLIFCDTEFTDFIDCDLISIGLVAEDGKSEFYAERNDYESSWCNPFVQSAVLPQLGQNIDVICSRDELSQRLWTWFAALPRHVKVACDSMHDRDLLWDAFDEGLPENLDRTVMDLRQLIDTTVFHQAVCRYQSERGRWHHALHDARAHRAGWLAWMDATKGCKNGNR